jgi:probable phosphoglycerate mutase
LSSALVLRHGETEWSRSGRHTGRTDLPLLEDGREQARALRPALEQRRFALVLASPLQRAMETARLAGLEPEPEPDLLEWNYGDYEGLTRAEIQQRRPGWLIWRDGPEGGESPEDVAARADRVIARIEQAAGEVCIVAHGHVLRMLTVRWLGQPFELGSHLPLPPTGLGRLDEERGVRVLQAWGPPHGPLGRAGPTS